MKYQQEDIQQMLRKIIKSGVLSASSDFPDVTQMALYGNQ
jgi:hypothetical protein